MPPADPLFDSVQRALAGQYSLERELGRGGMGVVYLAREVELDRHVALKVLPPAFAADPETRTRFIREARMAASLSHPHVVSIYRVGEIGDVVFFTMAFVDGMTLGERLRTRGPLPPSASSRMLREVAQALAYAHGRGIIHRDVKPDNILMERESGRALVSDFGIAGGVHDDSPRAVMGTPQFMSPEQSAAQSIDTRSDLYSLGAVGYLALSGSLPFHGATFAEIETARRRGAAPSLGVASPSTPPHLVAAVDRALKLDAADRFQSAESFANAIEAKSVVRVELPAPLRAWLDAKDPWMTPYVGWSLAWIGVAAIQFMIAGRDLSDVPVALSVASLSLIPAVLFQSRHARLLFEQGYTVDDIRAAIAARDAEDADAGALAQKPRARWFEPVARSLGWMPLFATLWAMARPRPWLPIVADATIMVAAVLAFPILTALGVPIFPRALTSPFGRLSNWFWDSKLGEWSERSLMFRRTRAVAAHAFRPTEMVLGAAVEDLFKSLPAAYRSQIGDVPSVIDRLKKHAANARAALAHFEGITIAEGDPLVDARETARRNLADSVSAIESIRLDLLRLLGGEADLRPTTTVLDAARRVGDELDRVADAQREIPHVIRSLGLGLTPHTPA